MRRADVAVLPLGALSAVVLALEVFQSRLVAYSVQNVMIYAVIGIALLGFGAAGSLVAVQRQWLDAERLPTVLAWSALAFCVSIVVAHAAFVRMTPFLVDVDLLSLGVAGVLGLPFVAAGTVITLALSSGPRIGVVYAANLIGSGIGCFVPLTLLGPLDGEHLLGLLAVLSFVCAVPFVLGAPGARRSLYAASAFALLLSSLSFVFADRVFPIQPDPPPFGQLAGQYAYAKQLGIGVTKKYDRWNPTGRIEIIEFKNVPGGPEPYPALFYAQDSTAGSSLVRWDGRDRTQVLPSAEYAGSFVSRMCTETLYGQGYYVPRNRVLVIGLGGGPDLQCALYQNAKAIDVVEINRDSIAAIRGPLNAWVGGIGSDPRVTFHERDGRSFVHGLAGRFDLIQLSGVDTKNNLVSGSLALSENHLYTKEAFADYLGALTADGVLSFIRFGEPEALRLSATAIAALRELGIAHPEQHIAIASTGAGYGVLVRAKPWTARDAEALDRQLHPPYFRGFKIFYYEQNLLPFSRPAVTEYLPPFRRQNGFTLFFDNVAKGSLEDSIKLYPFDISPTSDDKPFFFDIWLYGRADTWRSPHVITLRNLLISVIGLSLLLILLPLRKLRARAGAASVRSAPLYFASVGLGFILLEVWLLHRFTMYLGHQLYSLSIVLATLLVATGVGALVGDRLLPEPGRRARVGSAAVVAGAMLAWAALPHVLEASWHASLFVRALIAIGFIGAIGFVLGQPFVAGLGWLRRREPARVPWCIGINGFFSVIGSVCVVPLLLGFGYTGSFGVSLACYVLAALLARFTHDEHEAKEA